MSAHDTEQALELFDSLEPVDVGFMIGSWKGQGFPTSPSLPWVEGAIRRCSSLQSSSVR